MIFRPAPACVIGLAVLLAGVAFSPSMAATSTWVWTDAAGRLAYRADEQGNTIPDFSRAGYGGGGVRLPDLPVVVRVTPRPAGDDGARIQAAIDEVSRRPADARGFRGAVLLERGTFRVAESLSIREGGVVLRGEGRDLSRGGTTIIATGRKKRSLIEIGLARGPGRREIDGTRRRITDAYVPWSARSFSVDTAAGYKVGDRLVVHRPSTAAWISASSRGAGRQTRRRASSRRPALRCGPAAFTGPSSRRDWVPAPGPVSTCAPPRDHRLPFAMKIPNPLCGALALALAFASPALPAADAALATDARAAMNRATTFMRSIAAEGGYLWRYSPDLKERAGENVATPTQIWVQPPGTPSMGMAFLRAYEATGDASFLDAAKAAAHALVVGQLESGGWDYVVDFDPAKSPAWYRRSDLGRVPAVEAAKRRNVSTFDDDNSQSALRLLLAVADAAKGSNEPRDVGIRAARDYALTKLLAAQRPNGGWPQRWSGQPVDPQEYPVQPASIPASYPREYPKANYNLFYTLNDNTHRDCVMTLLDAGQRLGRPEYRAAALKGGDFLLLAQLPEPQPVWAQQYNPQLQPAWARAFEPPSVCSGESVGVMRLLVDLYLETGDEKFLEPLPRAIAWFKRSEIAPGTWARMYELGTNTPIYGDRDGKIKYRLEDLSPERQTGYSWRGPYGVQGAIRQYEDVKAAGRAAILEKRTKAEKDAASEKGRAARAQALEPRVRAAIAALDAQGRWIAKYRGTEQIRTDTYIMNLRTLADYVEAVK